MTHQEILQKAKEDYPQILKDRHYLHSHAEVGFDLTQTFSYVKQQLEYMGYHPTPCGESGLVVLAGGKRPGKVFLLRADMDALPMKEEAHVSFASCNGNMHACGHDMHTAMLLEAARILKKYESEINGTIKLMFQPAEEILEGSLDMIKNGVLENPVVDAGMMIHVMTGMPFPKGTAIVSEGGVSAPAADYFSIKIQGKGCHGSMPNNGIDPINAAAHIVLGLQEIHARELSIMDQAALTIGSVHAGKAANAIPDTAILTGTLRAYDEEVRHLLKSRMKEIVEYTGTAFRTKATVTFDSGCPTLLNDRDLSQCTLRYIRELHGAHMALASADLSHGSGEKNTKSGGSEDFAYISQQIPTIMLALAAGNPKQGYQYPLHHPKVTFDEEALPYGAAIYAYVALKWLEEH